MIDITDYGFVPSFNQHDGIGIPARVSAVYKERYEIISEHGEGYARLKTSIYFGIGTEEFPTTGDFVLIQYNNSGDSLIIKTLDRKSFFSRRDPSPGRGEQAVAANFDYVFIMQSLNHDFNQNRLGRYLTSAWQSGATPVIVLTKADLTENLAEQILITEQSAAGVAVHAVSAHTGYGIDTLAEYLMPHKTIVFLGSSGVGKSSLVNTLAGDEIMDTNVTRDVDASKGRHTTTHRQLIMLKSGVMIIDTPGMRELGMWDVSGGLGEAYGDVEQFIGKCKFADCKHQSEPGCVIKAAIENGELSEKRLENYLKLKREAKFSSDKIGALRDKQQLHKEMAKRYKERIKYNKKKH